MILNLSDNFYIKYSNNVNDDTKIYKSSDSLEGIISFNWIDLSKVTTMTFKVYTSNKTNCKDELYRTVYLTLPRYNSYSSWSWCDGQENNSACHKYVTYGEMTYGEFLKRLSSENNKTSTNTNNVVNPTDNANNGNYVTYILFGVGVVILSIIIVLVTRKKRSKL